MIYYESYSITIRFSMSYPILDNEIKLYKHWLINNNATHVSALECPNGPNSRHIQSVVTLEQHSPKNYSNNKKNELIRLLPRPAQQCCNVAGKNVAIVVKYISDPEALMYMRGYPLKDLDLDVDLEDYWSTFDKDALALSRTCWFAHKAHMPKKRKRPYDYILDRRSWPQQIIEYKRKYIDDDVFTRLMTTQQDDPVKVILRLMLPDFRVAFQCLSPGRRYMILKERLKVKPDYDALIELLYETNFVGPNGQTVLTPFRG